MLHARLHTWEHMACGQSQAGACAYATPGSSAAYQGAFGKLQHHMHAESMCEQHT